MKISVITPRFSLAGVPLAQIRFAKALSSLGHDVVLLIGYVNKGYELPTIKGVNVQVLGKERVISMTSFIANHLKIIKPDVVFSAEDHLNVVVLIAAFFARSKAKISCSSRVTPFDTYSNKFLSKRWALKQLMKLFMRKAKVLKDGEYGYLTPVGDITSMANGIRKALKNPIPKDILKKAVEPFSELKVFEEHRKSLEISKSDFFPKNSKV